MKKDQFLLCRVQNSNIHQLRYFQPIFSIIYPFNHAQNKTEAYIFKNMHNAMIVSISYFQVPYCNHVNSKVKRVSRPFINKKSLNAYLLKLGSHFFMLSFRQISTVIILLVFEQYPWSETMTDKVSLILLLFFKVQKCAKNMLKVGTF